MKICAVVSERGEFCVGPLASVVVRLHRQRVRQDDWIVDGVSTGLMFHCSMFWQFDIDKFRRFCFDGVMIREHDLAWYCYLLFVDFGSLINIKNLLFLTGYKVVAELWHSRRRSWWQHYFRFFKLNIYNYLLFRTIINFEKLVVGLHTHTTAVNWAKPGWEWIFYVFYKKHIIIISSCVFICKKAFDISLSFMLVVVIK